MKKLKDIVNKFNQAKVLVVGDLILDQYIRGTVEKISPEAPVPIVWAKERSYVPGGAANVANNISALGAKVCLCGVVGEDLHASKLLEELKKRKIGTSGVLTEKKRLTTLKTRVIAGHQQVVRVDWEHIDNISQATKAKLIDFISKEIKNFDAIIIEDYGKGLLDCELTEKIIKAVNANNKIITIDPKEDNFDCYFKATCITPNRKEAQNAIRYLKMKDTKNKFKIYKEDLSSHNDIKKAGASILEHLKLESLLITLGEDGMWLFEKNKNVHIPTVAQEVFDVSGAGDTVIAVFTLALSCGADKAQAAQIANVAAGIVVGKLGTATTSRLELTERL